jgi:FtsH-binding integral membrane protein
MIETLILVFTGLILGAFALRVIVWALKSIYKSAPFIVIWVILLSLMYWIEHKYIPESQGKNATVTKTTENKR